MSIALVGDPGNGNVDVYPSGLIVLRAEDFIGPARGTLAAVSDSASVAGTVVEETQDLAVPTTFSDASPSTRWTSSDDTLQIPTSIVSPYMTGEFNAFIAIATIKVSGDPPTNARWKQIHTRFRCSDASGGGAAAGFAWGSDTDYISAADFKTSLWGPQYKHTDPQLLFWGDFSGATNITVRAWTVTGGTLEYLIDMVYLLPWDQQLMSLLHFSSSFPPFSVRQNGVVFADQDNDDTDNVIGQFSVGTIPREGPFSGGTFDSPSSTDFQEADDEPTVYDITDGTWSLQDPPFSLLDPKSWMNLLAAPHYLPTSTLIDDDFSGAALSGGGTMFPTAPNGYLMSGENGNFGGPGHPNGTSGWTRDGAGNMRCSIVRSSAVPTGTYGAPFPRAHAAMTFGLEEWDYYTNGPTPSSDPRDYYPMLTDLQDFVLESTFACDVAGEVTAMYGFESWGADFDAAATGLLDNAYGLCLDLSGATLTAFLRGSHTAYGNNDFDVFSSTSTLTTGYTPGDVWNVKVERRRYRLRAKVWASGGGEPGSWTFDEYMPAHFNNQASSVFGWIQYPYDANWPGDNDHDNLIEIYALNQQSRVGVMCMPHQTSPDQIVSTQYFTLTLEPEGSSLVDMLVAEEDYDGSNHSNDVTIPYSSIPSPRFVEGTLRNRHFGADSNGFNVFAWKDGGAGPELQSSAIPFIFELGQLRRRQPQIYRRIEG